MIYVVVDKIPFQLSRPWSEKLECIMC